MANRATSAILNPIDNLCNYFCQANCWKAHGIAFGAMVQDLEHKLMFISMIWRFQICYWERWNLFGTLESISGEGCTTTWTCPFDQKIISTDQVCDNKRDCSKAEDEDAEICIVMFTMFLGCWSTRGDCLRSI